ncbi:transmembrane protein 41 homolog [Anopheles gambiae]|uniref:transmembrane protein 41 homolog n=1 Tax=Anopheles gambiae TaxID=7165 RepID=UPI002AC9B0D3|nr:transmembrane protein 41 homolog [Anopheles gambiae]XP_061517124.1 transmembrane protein 41 homolog [Anopheles gambiae]XP_311307.5 transmembrane protein 41 homolog [Anopheles gambiae]
MAPDANGTALYGSSNNNNHHHHHHEQKLVQQRPSATMNGSAKAANGGPPQPQQHSKASSPPADEDRSARQSLFILAAIFFTSLFAMVYVYAMFPQLEESEKQYLKVPFDIEDAKQLGRVLDRYKDLYNLEVMFGIILVYIFLQTFAIPGSLFLSILSGFLYSFPVALTLVCFCSALGATLCYLLSQLVGRRLVKYYFPERAHHWAKQVDRHRDDLLSYMLFLRMTPFLPNWFINLVAPVIGVPLYPFALGTFLGVAPPSFIAIQAGKTLYKMTSSSDAFSWGSIAMLAAFSVVALVPVIFKRYFKAKID